MASMFGRVSTAIAVMGRARWGLRRGPAFGHAACLGSETGGIDGGVMDVTYTWLDGGNKYALSRVEPGEGIRSFNG
jgi:hypothetical protein